MMIYKTACFFILLGFCHGATAKPIVVAVFGDSVTRGVWADSNLGNPGLKFYLSASRVLKIVDQQLSPKQLALIEKPASNPKANTQLMEQQFSFVANAKLSGAAGTADYSFATRLQAVLQKPVKLINVAKLAGSYQLGKSQLTALSKRLNGRKPDYILVNFTAMDALFQESIADFQRYIGYFYKALLKRYPHSTVLITPINDVTPLLILPDQPAVPAFLGFDEFSCYAIRKKGYGLFARIDANSPPAVVDELRHNIGQMNRVLKQELDKIADGEGSYAQFRGKIAMTQAIEAENENWGDYLAADCIHPNQRGQALIADALWQALLSVKE